LPDASSLLVPVRHPARVVSHPGRVVRTAWERRLRETAARDLANGAADDSPCGSGRPNSPEWSMESCLFSPGRDQPLTAKGPEDSPAFLQSLRSEDRMDTLGASRTSPGPNLLDPRPLPPAPPHPGGLLFDCRGGPVFRFHWQGPAGRFVVEAVPLGRTGRAARNRRRFRLPMSIPHIGKCFTVSIAPP